MIIQRLAGQTTAPPARLNFDSSVTATGAEVFNGLGTYRWRQPAVAEQLITPGFDRSHFERRLFEFKKVHHFLLTHTSQGQIYSDMVCATRQDKDSCQDDSGVSLILSGNDFSSDIFC